MKFTIVLRLGLLALLCGCSAARAADIAPLPAGWFLAGTDQVARTTADDYAAGVDSAVTYDGRASAYIGSKGSVTSHSFGTFMQTFAAKKYLGRRVKFSAAVKTKNATYVGLWMRVDGSLGSIRFDNMRNRPIAGTTGWKVYDVVLDVPRNAVSISLGLLDSGTGEAWMSGSTFGIVGQDTPTTDTLAPASLQAEPRNLIF